MKDELGERMKELPLSLTIRIDATNGSTMTSGVEAVCKILKTYNSPKKGQIIDDKQFDTPYWKVTIIDAVTSLE
jgi:hypothetical protein